MDIPNDNPSTTSVLIAGARVEPFINIRPDLKNIVDWSTRNNFKVEKVLVNKPELSDHPKVSLYSTKDWFRTSFTSFIAFSKANYLIFYYAGHGNHIWNHKTNNNQEALLILPDLNECYTDIDLTEDIDQYLPEGKTLYLVIDACNSGGMLNMWHMNTRMRKSITAFTGAVAEVVAWDDDSYPGGEFTNAFIRYAQVGKELYQIAEDVLAESFVPGVSKRAHSTAVKYSHPSLCVTKFCCP